jgi:hypothetical protein
MSSNWPVVAIVCLVAGACGGVEVGPGPLDGGGGGAPDSGAMKVIDGGRVVDTGATMFIDAPLSVRDTSPMFEDVIATEDVTSSQDDATTTEAGVGCPSNEPFTPVTWAPPTPLHQNVCTAAEATTYANAIMTMTMGLPTSGNAACDACIQTDESAPAHGPIVTNMGMPIEFNIGGCMAHFDGMTGPMGCGAEVNDEGDCANDECAGCSDFNNPSPMGPTEQCESAVFGAGGPCGSFQPNAECQEELQSMDGGVAECLEIQSVLELLNLWCGP